MTDREKLADILVGAVGAYGVGCPNIKKPEITCAVCEWGKYYPKCSIARLADYLLAHGVTVPVRCKECIWGYRDLICVNPKCGKSFYGCPVRAEHYCSYGERKDDETD